MDSAAERARGLDAPPVGPAPGAPLGSLLERHQKGEAGAFEDLYRLLHPRLVRFFEAWSASASEADDLAQITMLRLHEARHTYEASRPAGPWIWAIARNVRADEARRFSARDRRRAKIEQDPAPPAADPAELLEKAADEAALRTALQRLPEGQREVIFLHHFEGLALKEVAGAVGCTLIAAKLRAHRGYETLRRVLRRDIHGVDT